MYQISELAALVGMSRTALLYYEKQKLITGRRLDNGYRVYSDEDRQRIQLIQKLRAGGLTLKECKACMEAKVDRQLLQRRLLSLDKEIEEKQRSRALLAAMLGEGNLNAWHQSLDRLAPEAHLDWLVKQGFSEKEALRLKWLSNDMNEHDVYMKDFMRVFQKLERWGPGSDRETLKALSLVPIEPDCVVDIGCGKGLATRVLAQHCDATISAVDNEASALKQLLEWFQQQGLSDRLEAVCASMTELPFPEESFDLIWAEGSAYIMGVEKALFGWRPLLRQHGCMVISDMVWRTATPSKQPKELWDREYPDIQQVQTRVEQMQQAGYRVVEHFPMSDEAWQNYYGPLGEQITLLESEMSSSAAFADIKHEFEISTHFAAEFGYQMFVLQKC